jgi:hypothetical protein
MEGLIVGIGKGTFGNAGTPLVLGNLWEFLNPAETKAAVLANADTYFVTQAQLDKIATSAGNRDIKYVNEADFTTGNYTFIAADKDLFLVFAGSSSKTLTIPDSIFASTDELKFIHAGIGDLTFTNTSGIYYKSGTLNSPFSVINGGRISAKVQTPTSFWIHGDLLPDKLNITYLGSYTDDAAAGTGGVAVGYAYVNSSTGIVHRRLT